MSTTSFQQQFIEKKVQEEIKTLSKFQRCVDLSQEKGASTWLTAMPLAIMGLPSIDGFQRCSLSGYLRTHPHCSCGHPLSVDHALSCPTGSFPSIRHNELRDITASLLSEVCHGVSKEPCLQPLTGESMSHHSVITELHGAELDIAAHGFWEADSRRHFWMYKGVQSMRSIKSASLSAVCIQAL